jgi:hypothetical protein
MVTSLVADGTAFGGKSTLREPQLVFKSTCEVVRVDVRRSS